MREAALVGQNKLLRSIECYTRAYLFLSVDGSRWIVLHMNDPAREMTGVSQGCGSTRWRPESPSPVLFFPFSPKELVNYPCLAPFHILTQGLHDCLAFTS